MRLAVSNIAWNEEDDERVAELMVELGFSGLEIAPTRVWPQPLETTPTEIAKFRSRWEQRGIRVIAMQALLFGRPDLTIFRTRAQRDETLTYLKDMIRLGASLGAHALVFGSPRNRSIAGVDPADVQTIACAFFKSLGDFADTQGTCLCIEPNPPEYGCDFVTNVAEAEALVASVDSPGFQLHLDAGEIALVGEPIEETFARVAPNARHFHVSEAHLVPVGSGTVDHTRLASALVAARYDRWLSVEMRRPDEPDSLTRLRTALQRTVDWYALAAA